MEYFSNVIDSRDSFRGLSEVECFDKGFQGQVLDKQVLYDPSWHLNKASDMRGKFAKGFKSAFLQKAGTSMDAGLTGGIGTGGAGTAGSALIPVWISPEITDQTAYETPLRNLIRRIAVRGKTIDFNIITAKGGAHWRTEHGSLPEDVDTYDRVSVNIKFGYSVGELTGVAIAAMRGYVDAEALDLRAKTAALFELEEDTIVNGDLSTYPTEFNGLIKGVTSHTTNLSGTAVTLADIRNELAITYQARSIVDLAVTDVYTHNYVKGLLMDFQRQPAAPAEGLPFGIPGAFQFDGVNFIRSQFMPTTASARRIVFVNTKFLFMGVLLDVTFEEIATPTDSRKYMLKVYEALANQYEGGMSQIYGIL